jgi:AraC family transcriptional regulator, ethanolamine operon transcriptional activator
MIKDPHTTQSVHLQGFSPEQLLEVVRGARFEHYILSRAKCDARLNRWSLGDFTVDIGRYSFPVRAVGSFPKNRLCFGYMRHQSGPTWVNGCVADETTVEFYPNGAELNYRASPHGEWVAIEFEESTLQRAARERLGHEVDLPWKHVISFHVPRVDRLAINRMVTRLWKHPISGVLMIAPILGVIAEMLHAQRRPSFATTISKSQHRQMILKRSDEFLRGHLANPFQLEALATASGTTVRTLQRLFNDAYGVTPQKWARCLALHRARQHLQSPEARALTVQGIANGCGFRHMGRFSTYYRELFGEAPSFTLTNRNEKSAQRGI